MNDSDCDNIGEFVGGRSGSFVDELESLTVDRLEHLDRVLSVVDMDHEWYREWIDGDYESVLSELDFLYILRSSYDTVETKKSPSGTSKDFDLYFEYDGRPVWLEVKTPDMLSEISGGGVSGAYTPDKVWDYIRSPKFEEIDNATPENHVLLLGIGKQVPLVQELETSRKAAEVAPNWNKYVDDVVTYIQIPGEDLSFDLTYHPLTEAGEDVIPAFENLDVRASQGYIKVEL